jgi:hypothetical protein
MHAALHKQAALSNFVQHPFALRAYLQAWDDALSFFRL